MKIVDIDKLFENHVKKYVKENGKNVKPEQIEEMIGRLYESFAKEALIELDGLSAEEYYKGFDAQTLANGLKEHIESGVPVPEYLCEAIVNQKEDKYLINLLDSTNEELLTYTINILSEIGSKNATNKYLQILAEKSVSEPVMELITETLCETPDEAKEVALRLIQNAEETEKLYYIEILSRCQKDDRILPILVSAFRQNPDQMPLYAQYLSRYGDAGALSVLYEAIESDIINYLDFKELKMAIESLGGEYTKQRDFTKDPIYKKLNQTS